MGDSGKVNTNRKEAVLKGDAIDGTFFINFFTWRDYGVTEKDPNRFISENEIFLWPGKAPGSENLHMTEQINERSKDPNVLDREINRITKPSIIPFLPSIGKANGAAILIIPGGGYERLVVDKEGYDLAQWLNSKGVAAFVLKYRLPGEGHEQRHLVPLQDAQRAMRLIRHYAEQWGIEANRVGVLGSSAGGHLATTLGTKYATEVYKAGNGADLHSAKPNFMILNYPVISMEEAITHAGSREKLLGKHPSEDHIHMLSNHRHVDVHTPPTFIVHAHDDVTVASQNSIVFYEALKEALVDAELHIFRKGGHGFGIRQAEGSVALWTQLAEEWLIATGFIN